MGGRKRQGQLQERDEIRGKDAVCISAISNFRMAEIGEIRPKTVPPKSELVKALEQLRLEVDEE